MKTRHYLSVLLFLASAQAFSGEVKTKDEAIALAIGAIHEFRLTTIKDECGAIAVIEKPSYFDIVVRERHTQDCGGTLETAPRLFTVRVRKKDAQLSSDVYDGTSYQPIDHKPEPLGSGQQKP